MVVAIGPCFLLAPVVAVLAVLAIPLWPVCLAVLLVLLLVIWPIEQIGTRLGIGALRGASARVWGWLRWMSTPWNWFDLPSARPADNATAPRGSTEPGAPGA